MNSFAGGPLGEFFPKNSFGTSLQKSASGRMILNKCFQKNTFGIIKYSKCRKLCSSSRVGYELGLGNISENQGYELSTCIRVKNQGYELGLQYKLISQGLYLGLLIRFAYYGQCQVYELSLGLELGLGFFRRIILEECCSMSTFKIILLTESFWKSAFERRLQKNSFREILLEECYQKNGSKRILLEE